MRSKADATFLKHNAIFWSASLFVAFLNYLYYPVLGRLLHPAAFGETQTIISIFTQAGSFFQVLGLVSIGIITKYADEETRTKLNNELSRLALLVSLVFFAVSIIFSPWLTHFFHFSDVGPFLLLGVSLLLNVPFAFANAYLQGNKQFNALSKVNILGAVTKLVSAIVFVLLGWKTLGAIGGLICAQLVGLALSLKLGKGIAHFIATHLHLKRLDLQILKPELPYALMVLATSLTTNLLLSFDILVVKHYFPPEQAGLYTGISIISNIIYFITGPFAGVMIPSISPAHTSEQNSATLRRSLLLTGTIGGATLLVFVLVPRLITLILLGHKYTPYASNLRGLALSMFALSVANLLIYYHIGLRHFWVAPAVLVGLMTTIGLLIREHSTLGMVVQDLVAGSLFLLILLSALLLPYRYRKAVA